MDPRKLAPILALLATIPGCRPEEQNDFVTWLCGGLGSNQVEICSGVGHASRALWSCGFRGKAFDATCLLNVVARLALEGAVQFKSQPAPDYWLFGYPGRCKGLSLTVRYVWREVANTKPGGLVLAAPPCSTWVFLCPVCTCQRGGWLVR